jgi:threonyl-tRNA synthetase
MEYIASDGSKHQPYMIHRAIMGSLERFVGILIENTMGDFPVWISPVQATVIPITNFQNGKAEEFYQFLHSKGIRVELNDKNDTMGAKIRQAELEKIPYMFIIGEREAEKGTVSVRRRKSGDKGIMSRDEAYRLIEAEIQTK